MNYSIVCSRWKSWRKPSDSRRFTPGWTPGPRPEWGTVASSSLESCCAADWSTKGLWCGKPQEHGWKVDIREHRTTWGQTQRTSCNIDSPGLYDFYDSLSPRFHDTRCLWHQHSMTSWVQDSMTPWIYGSMTVWLLESINPLVKDSMIPRLNNLLNLLLEAMKVLNHSQARVAFFGLVWSGSLLLYTVRCWTDANSHFNPQSLHLSSIF